MKTKNYLLKRIPALITLIYFMLNSYSVKSQCFLDPGIAEISSGCNQSGSNVQHTGNDSRYSLLNSLNSMMVNVYDGDNPGLSFYEFSTSPFWGCIPLPNDIHDPDVVLVEGTQNSVATWFAIVVYEYGGKCICDVYEYNGSTFTQSSGWPVVLNNCNGDAYYSSSINIDADAQNGNFVIVWDDAAENRIIAQGGYCSSSSTPGLNGRAIVIDGSQYQMPDVSLASRGYISGMYRTQVFVSYVNSSNTEINVDGGYYENWIASNSCTTTNANHSQTIVTLSGTGLSGLIYYPRIACPNYLTSNNYSYWTVVSEVYNSGGGIDDIFGATYNGSLSKNVYTDGGSSSPCIAIDQQNNERNRFPVVSYDDNYDGFVVCWESEYSGDVLNPKGIVSLYCNTNGSLNTTCGNYYFVVSYNNMYNNTFMRSASLSGRDFLSTSHPIMYSFYDHNLPDVVYKADPWLTCHLRAEERLRSNLIQYSNIFQNSGNLSDLINMKFSKTDKINIRLLNSLGQILYSGISDLNSIDLHLNRIILKAPFGIYYLQLISDDAKTCIVSKLTYFNEK